MRQASGRGWGARRPLSSAKEATPLVQRPALTYRPLGSLFVLLIRL